MEKGELDGSGNGRVRSPPPQELRGDEIVSELGNGRRSVVDKV